MNFQKWQLMMVYWRRYLHPIYIVDIYSYCGYIHIEDIYSYCEYILYLFILWIYMYIHIVDINSYCG